MNNTTVIIPIHKYDTGISDMLIKALDSINGQIGIDLFPDVLIVYTPDIETDIRSFVNVMNTEGKYKFQIGVIINDTGKTDFQTQVNIGAKSIQTGFFSVLEFDDEYAINFFKLIFTNIKAYPKVDIYLPIMIEVNTNNQAIKLTNELVWSQQFVGENGEVGFLNTNTLEQYTDFKISGAIIKTSEFLNIGGLKSNIKLTFNLEFLLRALNNALKIYTMPKIGYKHVCDRLDSLNDFYLKTMPVEERKHWFDIAKRESNFATDRIIGI